MSAVIGWLYRDPEGRIQWVSADPTPPSLEGWALAVSRGGFTYEPILDPAEVARLVEAAQYVVDNTPAFGTPGRDSLVGALARLAP